MTYFIFVFYIAVLGAIMGSFLNVVAVRFHTGKSLQGRSQCFSCGSQLRWYELIPVVSWLIQRGRCRTCSSKIPRELLFSELASACIFFLIALRYGIVHGSIPQTIDWVYAVSTVYLLLIFSLYLIILLYDIRHKIIPDFFSFLLIVLTSFGLFFFGFSGKVFSYIGPHIPHPMHILGAILIPLPFALIWFFSKGRMMGLGDPKLMVSIMLLLGFSHGVTAIVLAFWVGLAFIISYGIGSFLIQKLGKKGLYKSSRQGILKKEIPFAPFLITGALIVTVTGLDLFALNLL